MRTMANMAIKREISSENQVYYRLGKRDAVAETLMLVRERGERAALLQLADELLTLQPEHPHALWVKENLAVDETEGESE